MQHQGYGKRGQYTVYRSRCLDDDRGGKRGSGGGQVCGRRPSLQRGRRKHCTCTKNRAWRRDLLRRVLTQASRSKWSLPSSIDTPGCGVSVSTRASRAMAPAGSLLYCRWTSPSSLCRSALAPQPVGTTASTVSRNGRAPTTRRRVFEAQRGGMPLVRLSCFWR